MWTQVPFNHVHPFKHRFQENHMGLYQMLRLPRTAIGPRWSAFVDTSPESSRLG